MGNFSFSTSANEAGKFVESQAHPGKVAIAVTGPDGSGIGSSLWTLPFDSVTVAYPTDTSEVYSSRQGGVTGAVQEVITVNYTDDTKANISSVARI